MKKILNISLLSLALTPLFGQAMGIDSMLNTTVNGKTDFTVTSGASYREFIQVGIAEIKVENGELVKTPYTRDNINTWSLMVRPARTVIEPKQDKLFQVEHSPTPVTDSSKDHVYQLSFIPTPYFAEGESVTHAVKLALGFAPVVIVPAKEDKPIRYKMQRDGDRLMLKNNGDTYLRVILNSCSRGETESDKCRKVYQVLSGRNLSIPLSDSMAKAPELKVELSTHNLDYKQSLILKPRQASASKE
ncbi:hypothetical protein [Vibrio metoecus]|uniref:hypothetical protein n=1 Tax=Vibrio metoecus TaxID=1481663 RepID=UPI0001B99A35|nr:hypothetical protein [Vibrio metoecus]EEX66637.1 hypothetical protein VCJ_001046 [Vibrio metoecus]